MDIHTQRTSISSDDGADKVSITTLGSKTGLDVNVAGGGVVELKGYAISDKDDDSEPNYYGYVKSDGSWYIMKELSSSYRYAAGTSGYTTAWTGRAALSYDYFYTTF